MTRCVREPLKRFGGFTEGPMPVPEPGAGVGGSSMLPSLGEEPLAVTTETFTSIN
jgi:hypothetical protein